MILIFFQILRTETDLREGMKKLDDESDVERVKAGQAQLTAVLLKKVDLIKQASSLETDIVQKEKALKKSK